MKGLELICEYCGRITTDWYCINYHDEFICSVCFHNPIREKEEIK